MSHVLIRLFRARKHTRLSSVMRRRSGLMLFTGRISDDVLCLSYMNTPGCFSTSGSVSAPPSGETSHCCLVSDGSELVPVCEAQRFSAAL